MSARKRDLFVGMTDYTGVSMEDILSHLRDWHDGTVECIEALRSFETEVEDHRQQLESPNDILAYIRYFIDLLERYAADFERLLRELPEFVTEAHVEIVQQIRESASLEESKGSRFARDHVEAGVKDEALRWLVDGIYQQSAGMLFDYHDLSNLAPRLRTFVGARPPIVAELEQKFRILRSAGQEEVDFSAWAADGSQTPEYSIGVIFFDVDDFKVLNSRFTESSVDRDILAPLQHLVRAITMNRGHAYRQGGEEFVILLPNCTVDETSAFAEKLRARIEAEVFTVQGGGSSTLTVSEGVAVWPVHGETLDEVRAAANRAEHEAKTAGKNRVQVAPT